MSSHRRLVVITLAGLMTLGAAWLWYAYRPTLVFTSIAVLPFLSDGVEPKEAAHHIGGIGQILSSKMARLNGLKVAPWESSRRYGDPGIPPQAIGKQLDVATLVTGTLRVEGSLISGVVSLVDTASGKVIWSDPFEASESEMFTLLRELAIAIATQVRGRLSDQDIDMLGRPPARTVPAFDAYSRGAALVQAGDETSVTMAEALFRRAVDLDPELADAWMALGAVNTLRYFAGWVGEEGIDQAEQSFRTALRLDPGLAAARNGLVRVHWERGQAEECLAEGKRATDYHQDTAHMLVRAGAYMFCGLPGKALQLLDAIITVDPANSQAFWFRTIATVWDGRYEETITAHQDYTDRFGEDPELLFLLGQSHYLLGHRETGLEMFEKAFHSFPDGSRDSIYSLLALAYRLNGREKESAELLREGMSRVGSKVAEHPDHLRVRLEFGWLHALLGNRDQFDREVEFLLSKAPDNGLIRQELAGMYYYLGDNRRAIELLRENLGRGWVKTPQLLLLQTSSNNEPLKETQGYEDYLLEFEQVSARLRALY